MHSTAVLLLNLWIFPKVFTDSIPTLAVGKSDKDGLLVNLYVNPSYVEGCVNDLLKKDLSAKDRLAVTKISNAVQKY